MLHILSTLRRVRQEHKFLFLISLMALFYVAGNGSVWFVLPLIADKIVKDLALVGLLIAIPNFVSMFLDVPVGGFSDYIGRKKLLGLGLILMALLGLMLPSISSIFDFVIFMVIFGIANQFIFISGRAFLMDISPKGKTSGYFGVFEALAQIGFVIGPIIAGILIVDKLDVGVVNIGIFYLIMCLIALIVVFMLKEIITEKGLISSVQDIIKKDRLIFRELLEFKELKAGGVMVLILTFAIVTTDGLIWTMEPLYTKLGLDPAFVGLILGMFVLPYILFDAPAGILADKIGKVKMIVLGLIIAGLFLIIFGHLREPILLLLSAFIATTGLALVRPSVDGLLTDLAEKKHKGGIVGIWDVSEDLGYVVGPILGGIIAEYYSNIGAAFIVMGIIILLIIPLVLLSSRKIRLT